MYAAVYLHVADLLILAGRKPLDYTYSHLFPRDWSSIQTPMCACGFLADGLHVGFRVGFRYGGGGAVCKGVASNMPTACDHPEVVSEFLEKELRAGRHSSSIGSNTGARNARLDQGGLNQHVQSFF